MTTQIKIPAGFVPATAAAMQRLSNKQMNGNVILSKNEQITVQSIVSSEKPIFEDSKGNKFYLIRFLCQSSVKPDGRLLTINHFNPFPKERVKWLEQTEYGKDTLSFQGNVENFANSLVGKTFTTVKVEKLPCTVWRDDKKVDGETYFHLFEYSNK